MYVDRSIKEYLEMVESGEPTPGVGSVASLVSSLGAALTLMTSNFSLYKDYFKELDLDIQEKVRQAHKDIKNTIEIFNKFMDEDAKGFAAVIEAYNQDKPETKEEKQQRLEERYKRALATPLRCSRECLELLKLQSIIVEYGNRETITDVGVGIILVYAALESSLISVKINLNYIEDREYTKEIEDEMKKIYKEANIIKDYLREKVDRILGS